MDKWPLWLVSLVVAPLFVAAYHTVVGGLHWLAGRLPDGFVRKALLFRFEGPETVRQALDGTAEQWRRRGRREDTPRQIVFDPASGVGGEPGAVERPGGHPGRQDAK